MHNSPPLALFMKRAALCPEGKRRPKFPQELELQSLAPRRPVTTVLTLFRLSTVRMQPIGCLLRSAVGCPDWPELEAEDNNRIFGAQQRPEPIPHLRDGLHR